MNQPILSLYLVQRLTESLIDFHPTLVNMCIRSCQAYTGAYTRERNCSYIHNRVICGQARYGDLAEKRPRTQFLIMLVMVMI